MRLAPLPVPPALLVPTREFRSVGPTAVARELVVDTGGLRPSCLRPSESRRVH
ncbi:hypothetical protein [Saccharothrix stipae]